jgi:hypothetical protein
MTLSEDELRDGVDRTAYARAGGPALRAIDADSDLVRIEACGICGSDTEQAIRTLACEIPGEESIHSFLIDSGALVSRT